MFFQNNLSARFLNLHTHSPTGDPDVLEIESLYYGQDIVGANGFRSVGLHPWHLRGLDLDAAEQWLYEQGTRP